eukprot:TRINITY_DN4701_c0_g1_i2.p1 TRINITY_DN4701_c0_g1~~TRINITY_DN4701_c0_g1_i2.p1  ORF type:complete len:283 (+),score=63.06 TRINITY_DN4701_c0_g1_i2:959-1807(+)
MNLRSITSTPNSKDTTTPIQTQPILIPNPVDSPYINKDIVGTDLQDNTPKLEKSLNVKFESPPISIPSSLFDNLSPAAKIEKEISTDTTSSRTSSMDGRLPTRRNSRKREGGSFQRGSTDSPRMDEEASVDDLNDLEAEFSSLKLKFQQLFGSNPYEGDSDSYLIGNSSNSRSNSMANDSAVLSSEDISQLDSIIHSIDDSLKAIAKSDRWVVVRRYRRRGGVKIKIPDSMFELKLFATEKFLVDIVSIREEGTEALLTEIDAIKNDSIVLALTKEEENEFC